MNQWTNEPMSHLQENYSQVVLESLASTPKTTNAKVITIKSSAMIFYFRFISNKSNLNLSIIYVFFFQLRIGMLRLTAVVSGWGKVRN